MGGSHPGCISGSHRPSDVGLAVTEAAVLGHPVAAEVGQVNGLRLMGASRLGI